MTNIESVYDLPNMPHRHYNKHSFPMDEAAITKVFEKEFHRKPEQIFKHHTGIYIPVTQDEFDQVKVSLYIHVPEARPE